ncbi:type I restriction-modification system subunit M N-terminal domain-containing protein [Roseovarius sp. 10]|nr:type I restriction-modification system subunit M N-terminal domain-containing protein [Roseovarius sp. 10]MDV7201124.1 type I restriction-modification system subunit M N-terminal domain-containing protein [Roseovarius sp. 10]
MYENAFNSIEKTLRAEEGIANELDYVEQTSWVLFLKYLHDLESERRDRAELEGKQYAPIIDGRYSWDRWAAPESNGGIDYNTALSGDDLVRFVDQELFPHLASFRDRATDPDTIEYKIGEVFTELRSKFRSGYILRDVLEVVNGMEFKTQADKHELSSLYETRIRRMGNAGRNGGEYYTPRPLIRAMIKVIDPKLVKRSMTVLWARQASCAKHTTTCAAATYQPAIMRHCSATHFMVRKRSPSHT